MLESLKKKISDDLFYTSALESSLEKVATEDDDIRDIMLDDPDAQLIGAENDPQIKKLVDMIPDTPLDEDEEVDESDIKKLDEALDYDGVVESAYEEYDDSDIDYDDI